MTAAADRNLGRWLHANVVYWGIVTLRGEREVFERLRELRVLEGRRPEELEARQTVRLATALEYARTHSPFYAERWPDREPVVPAHARELLATLPIVEKSDLQGGYDRMVARPVVRPVTRKITGGSTGQAVTVIKDRRATAAEMAASWMGYGWFGIRPGDKVARFWGAPTTVRRRLRFAAADVAMRRISFSSFAFDDGDLESYWVRCLARRPVWFYGYVSMLEAFAAFVRRRGLDGRRLGLTAIVTTSEVLTSPQRALLTEVFGCPVQNEYGCGEVGPIAYECERGGLHVMNQNLVVEVLTAEGRPAAEGESGEIVLTDLNNRAMPLVRYRVGDFGVPAGPCECGRGFPRLEKIWGRAYDFVQAPDGRRYHGEFFMYLFEDLRTRGHGVDQFQVTQQDVSTLDVALVSGGSNPVATRSHVEAAFAERLPGMRVAVRSVDTIPRAASGKMRLIRNPWLFPERN